MEFKGTIEEGFGQGAKYICLPGYKEQFLKKLNIIPYPGTLNIKTNINMSIFNSLKPIVIQGFKEQDKIYGSLKCYKCLINNSIDAWIIIIEKSTHNKDILEIISEKRIRDYYNKEISVKLQ